MTYREFRSNILKFLNNDDDDCIGCDTIMDSLKYSDPDHMSLWFKQVMPDW